MIRHQTMKTIIYTSPVNAVNEIDIWHQALDMGIDYLRLYKPKLDWKQKDILLAQMNEKLHQKIIVDEYELWDKYPTLGGVHFFEGLIKYSRFYPVFKEIIDNSPTITSASCHTIGQAKKYRNKFSFLMFSPIFDSNSKNKTSDKLKLEELKEYFSVKKSKSITFALGGVTPDKIERLKDIGFDGVAAMGYVWKKGDPLDNIKRIVEKCR